MAIGLQFKIGGRIGMMGALYPYKVVGPRFKKKGERSCDEDSGSED